MNHRSNMHLGFELRGEGTAGPIGIEPADLTTHAVCLGATGSGKTGLLIALLEEASLARVPILALDPKGDLTNLALVFPELRAADFAPWIEADAARRAGLGMDQLAEETAERWRTGLAADGIAVERLRRLSTGRTIRLYTPGSDAGTPIDVVSSLAIPEPHVVQSEEALAEAVSSTAGALLGLLGMDADPLTSKEHVFLSTVLENAWRSGRGLDLATLIGEIVTPSFPRVGVFEVDRFMHAKEREELALGLNALVAAPGFALWRRGVPLEVPALLGAGAGADGRAPLALVYLAHLGERERMFAAASILGAVVRWMRGQGGSGDLRLLVVMDEIFGFMPPHPRNPPAKAPLLTLLKQARAFGVGVVLATQNPVDADYKALSNAATWFLGRLATDQDRERVTDALRVGGGDSGVEALLAGLAPRHFVLKQAGRTPVVFRSRFAMSYLRGPLMRSELSLLTAAGLIETVPTQSSAANGAQAQKPVPVPAPPASPVGEASAPGDAASPVAPAFPAGTPERFLAPGMPALTAVAAVLPAVAPAPAGAPPLLLALVTARVALRFDEARFDLEHRVTFTTAGIPRPDGSVTWMDGPLAIDLAAVPVAAPEGARYLAAPRSLSTASGMRRLAVDLAARLQSTETITLWRHVSLKLVSAPGESREAFALRVTRAAEAAAADELAALRERYAERIERVQKQLDRAGDRHAAEKTELEARKRDEVLAAGESVLGFLFGRRSVGSLSAASRRRRMTQGAESQERRAAGEVGRLEQELEQLSAEVEDKAAELEARYEVLAAEIVPIEVGLERDDVRIEELGILWCALLGEPAVT